MPTQIPLHEDIVSSLRRRSTATPNREAYRYITDAEGVKSITYSELDGSAAQLSSGLQHHAQTGDRVVLLFPCCIDFVKAVFGVFYAGMIAVPAPPPRSQGADNLRAMIADSKPRIVIFHESLASRINAIRSSIDASTRLMTLTDLLDSAARSSAAPADRHPIAILQYTSGTTSLPRGAKITHANLIHNFNMISSAIGALESDHVLTWLPHFHDMGLIGGLLFPCHQGFRSTVTSPASFASRPISWMERISEHRASISVGPTSAYALCTQGVDGRRHPQLDLGCLRHLLCGSEPIRPDVIASFESTFATFGLRPSTVFPCYGLAEATLFVAGSPGSSIPRSRQFNRRSLAMGVAQSDASTGEALTAVACCGRVHPGNDVRIVDPATSSPLEDGLVGEIWIAGGNVSPGYWAQQEHAPDTFLHHIAPDTRAYLASGDLGFLLDGHLYITGRIKEIIIHNGHNIYPRDVELSVESVDVRIRPGSVLAFRDDGDGGEESMAVLLECSDARSEAHVEVCELVQNHVASMFDIQPSLIGVIPQRSLPRTSSGKMQREKCRSLLQSGALTLQYRWSPPEFSRNGADKSVLEFLLKLYAEGISSSERVLRIKSMLIAKLAAYRQLPPTAIRSDAPVSSYGLNSLSAMRLHSELEELLGVSLPQAVFWNKDSIDDIAELLTRTVEESNLRERQNCLAEIAAYVGTLSQEQIAAALVDSADIKR